MPMQVCTFRWYFALCEFCLSVRTRKSGQRIWHLSMASSIKDVVLLCASVFTLHESRYGNLCTVKKKTLQRVQMNQKPSSLLCVGLNCRVSPRVWLQQPQHCAFRPRWQRRCFEEADVLLRLPGGNIRGALCPRQRTAYTQSTSSSVDGIFLGVCPWTAFSQTYEEGGRGNGRGPDFSITGSQKTPVGQKWHRAMSHARCVLKLNSLLKVLK